jgi:hypothetical protein
MRPTYPCSAFCLVSLALLLSSCAHSIHLTDDYRFAGDRDMDRPSCDFNLRAVTDDRGQQSLGDIAGQKIYHDRLMAWFTVGLRSIPLAPQTAPGDCVDVDVSLKKVYGRSISTSLSCNVALAVRYYHQGVFLGEQIYRGVHTAPNMATTRGEIASAFDQSFRKALAALKQDLNSYCERARIHARP